MNLYSWKTRQARGSSVENDALAFVATVSRANIHHFNDEHQRSPYNVT